MTTHSMMSVCLGLLTGLGSPSQDSISLSFAPADGLVVEKRWTQEHKLVLLTLSTQVGTEAPEVHPVSGRLDSVQTLNTTDEYLLSGEGRPLRLRRRFDAVSTTGTMNLVADGNPLERKAKLASRLQGLGVQYTWVPEDREYGKFYFDAAGNEQDLAELGSNMDLLCLLPAGPVEVGSRWTVDPGRLVELLAPCGQMRLRPGNKMDLSLARGLRNGMGAGLETAFGGKLARAEFSVTLAEVRETDGQRVAVLKLVFRGNFLNEKSKFKVEDVLRREAERGARYDRSQISLDLEGKAEVLWSLDEGRFLSMELVATESVSLQIVEKAPDGSDVIQVMRMRGSLLTTFSSTPAPVKVDGLAK